jgi:hypothetical protein
VNLLVRVSALLALIPVPSFPGAKSQILSTPNINSFH